MREIMRKISEFAGPNKYQSYFLPSLSVFINLPNFRPLKIKCFKNTCLIEFSNNIMLTYEIWNIQ